MFGLSLLVWFLFCLFSPTDIFWTIIISGHRSVCGTVQFWAECVHQKMLLKFRYVIYVLWFFFSDYTQLSLTYGVVWFWFRQVHTGRLQFFISTMLALLFQEIPLLWKDSYLWTTFIFSPGFLNPCVNILKMSDHHIYCNNIYRHLWR